ncbi:MAG: PH domain-containing protein, partial [Solirubrobacteraceae bacterium]
MVAQPGEQIFFRGHPSWRSMVSFHVKGSLASLLAGVIAGLASAVADGHVQLAWVIAAAAVVFGLSLGIGQLRRQRLTYAITDQRLVIESGLFSRRLHQAGLERIQNVVARQSVLG